MSETSLNDVVLFILNAEKQHLDVVSKALQNRRKTLTEMDALTNLSTIYVGDRVKLVKISPKFLAGLPGTITNIEGETFSVELDFTPPRKGNSRQYSRNLKVSATCVEKIG